LYEDGVLAFESDNGCVHIEETAAPAGGWTPIAGNQGQLGFANGDVDTKEVHSRIHVNDIGELWISAKNLLDMVPPTSAPTEYPTAAPTDAPTAYPTATPTDAPTDFPTAAPTAAPTSEPTAFPTAAPTDAPSDAPSEYPTAAPTDAPTEAPTKDTQLFWMRCIYPEYGAGGCKFQWTDADNKCRETSINQNCKQLGTNIFGKDPCGAAVCSVTQPIIIDHNGHPQHAGRSGRCSNQDQGFAMEVDPCYDGTSLRTTCPDESELFHMGTEPATATTPVVNNDPSVGCNAGRRLGE
jgi:hypothetical protein